MRHEIEVQRAQAAVAAARSHIDAMPPRTLDDPQRTARRRLITALGRAERGYRGDWGFVDAPHVVIYEEVGKALKQLAQLERTSLDTDQREHVAEATRALHIAEDEVRDAFWHASR